MVVSTHRFSISDISSFLIRIQNNLYFAYIFKHLKYIECHFYEFFIICMYTLRVE